METQTTATSPEPGTKSMAQPSSLPSATKTDEVHSFDCVICYQSLTKPGPPLSSFTFGKLLINVRELTFVEREHIYREFGMLDQCFTDGNFDCDKVVSTICGHMYHAGCIREWFFVKRLERFPKCPFCNKITNYESCRILHPISCALEDGSVEDKVENPGISNVQYQDSDYSDISCTSSSWPSDGESTDAEEIEEEIVEQHDDALEQVDIVEDHLDVFDPEELSQNAVDEADGQYPPEVIPISTDDYDTDYYLVLVSENCNSINDPTFEYTGKLQKLMKIIKKCNLVHILTLIHTFECFGKMYQHEKKKFSDKELVMEDESLVSTFRDTEAPWGALLIKMVFAIGICVIFGEVFFTDIFERKRKNAQAKSSIMALFKKFLLSLFAIAYYICIVPTVCCYFVADDYMVS